MDLPIVMRAAEHGDVNFIRSSWLRSNDPLYSELARVVGRKAYYEGHHGVIESLVGRAELRVVCSAAHRSTIVGWSCVELPRVVHYVFVREEFRRHGVARMLLVDVANDAVYTHRTDVCKALPIPASWSFNVYRALTPTREAA